MISLLFTAVLHTAVQPEKEPNPFVIRPTAASWQRMVFVAERTTNPPFPVTKASTPEGSRFVQKDLEATYPRKTHLYLQKENSSLLVIVEKSMEMIRRIHLAQEVVKAAIKTDGLLRGRDLPDEALDGLKASGILPKDLDAPVVVLSVSAGVLIRSEDGSEIIGPNVGGVGANSLNAALKQSWETNNRHPEKFPESDSTGGGVALSEYNTLSLSQGYSYDFAEATEVTLGYLASEEAYLQELLTLLFRRLDEREGTSFADFPRHGLFKELSSDIRNKFARDLEGQARAGKISTQRQGQILAGADTFQLVRSLKLLLPDDRRSFSFHLGTFAFPAPGKS